MKKKIIINYNDNNLIIMDHENISKYQKNKSFLSAEKKKLFQLDCARCLKIPIVK